MLISEHAHDKKPPPSEGLRERNKREKVERITRSARALFVKQGYTQTSTREIARRANVGAGTVFLYFPEKVDLLCHLFERDIEHVVAAALDTMPDDGSLVDRLMHVFGALYDYYDRDRHLARIFIKELMFLRGAPWTRLADLTTGFLGHVVRMVEDARERGEIAADIHTFLAAQLCFGKYYFTLVLWLGHALESKDVALFHLRASLELFVRGLRAQGERS